WVIGGAPASTTSTARTAASPRTGRAIGRRYTQPSPLVRDEPPRPRRAYLGPALFGVVVLVLTRHAPRCVLGIGGGATFIARLTAQLDEVDRASVLLQGSRFFEAPMPSLLHVRLPG